MPIAKAANTPGGFRKGAPGMLSQKEVSAGAVDGDQHTMEHQQSRNEPDSIKRLHQQHVPAVHWGSISPSKPKMSSLQIICIQG